MIFVLKLVRIVAFSVIVGVVIYFSLGHLFQHALTTVDKNNIVSCKESKKSFTIVISENGFSPQMLRVAACDKVTLLNTGKRYHYPTFGDYPTHLIYPGFHELPLKTGQSVSVIMSVIGSYSIHDHIYSELAGKIIVGR